MNFVFLVCFVFPVQRRRSPGFTVWLGGAGWFVSPHFTSSSNACLTAVRASHEPAVPGNASRIAEHEALRHRRAGDEQEHLTLDKDEREHAHGAHCTVALDLN